MRTTLDTVDLSGYVSPTVSIQVFVQETGWEEDDALRIWVAVDGGTEIDLLNTAGSDIDDLGIEDSWRTLSETLAGYTAATLSFELDANAIDEAAYFDNVLFAEAPVPVAGSVEATVNGTFEEGGRDGSDWTFNVQGDDDAYHAWSAADFDTAFLGFASPIADITAFELSLTQWNAWFTNDGTVGFWITEETSATIGAESTLAWADTPESDGLGTQLEPRTFLGTGVFTETNSGDIDTYDLTAMPGFASVKPTLIDHINSGDTIRIIVAPTVTDTAVAATWAGYSSFSYDGPTLTVHGLTEPGALDPPTVSETAPSDGATGVSLDTTIALEFSESVDIAAGALSLECPAGVGQAFATSPALPATDVMSLTITPDGLLTPGTPCTATATASAITDATEDELDGDGDGTGGDDYTLSFTTVDCGGTATLIHDVQGSGPTSPEEGNVVTVEGYVVGDFQSIPGNAGLSGFFLQEEHPDWDGDDKTSEGIFVYEGSSSLLDVAVGDHVRLTGEVDEYYDLTQIKYLDQLGRCSSGHPVTPTAVTLPENVDGELEQVEGMLVEVTNEMTVAQNYFLGRYGQMTLSSAGRLFQPTNQYLPESAEAEALAEANARNLLILDDGMDVSSCGDNPDPVPYLGPPPPDVIRAGDTATNLVGVLDYGKINAGTACWDQSTFNRDYRLHPTEEITFKPTNPRTTAPPDVGGTLKVASFNVLNYFTTLDTGDDVCGPEGDQECRGADDAEEFTRQQAKIVEAICAIDADVLGLMELENQIPANDPEPGDGIDDYVLKDLVGALNDVGSPCPDRTYGFTDSSTIGTDPIRQGIIYKTSTVTPTGRAVLTDTAFTDPNGLGEDQSRPAVAETFEDGHGERFTVVVNHLKSKGSPCGEGDDDPIQGNCNDTRTKGAAYLVDWLATDPTGSGDPDVLIIGDLNAYAMEDPVMALVDAGFTDLLREFQGDTAYSYIFDGQSGSLDHGLANGALAPQVTGATEWHINADEPPVIDYDEDYNPEGYYSPDAYRASDHDPVIVGLRLTQRPYRSYMPLIARAWQPAIVKVMPDETTVSAGEEFTVDIVIERAADLHAFEFRLGFDPLVVTVEAAEVGEFLGSTGRSVITLGPVIDNDARTLTLGGLSMGVGEGPTGTGVLATVSLEAVGGGSSPLDLDAVEVFRAGGGAQTVAVQDGSVTVSE
jgi:hypothetical protein